jgi:hypothetical protein
MATIKKIAFIRPNTLRSSSFKTIIFFLKKFYNFAQQRSFSLKSILQKDANT